MIGNDPFWRSYFSNGLNPTYDICKMLSWWWGGFLASWWLGGQKIQPKKCRLVVTGILDGELNADFFLHQLIYSLSHDLQVFFTSQVVQVFLHQQYDLFKLAFLSLHFDHRLCEYWPCLTLLHAARCSANHFFLTSKTWDSRFCFNTPGLPWPLWWLGTTVCLLNKRHVSCIYCI